MSTVARSKVAIVGRARRLPPRTRAASRSTSASRGTQADPRLAWYAGLALMAALEIIDWPVALVIAVGHEIAHRARSQALRELAEGVEAGI
jgi:hypothetical protein